MRPVDYSKFTELTCKKCKQVKPVSDFTKYTDKSAPLTGWRYHSWCRDCSRQQSKKYGATNKERRNKRLRDWRKNNPQSANQNDLRKRYKKLYDLTMEQVEAMKQAQNGKCFLCEREGIRLVIDHDHNTGKVRKLLCDKCNISLGWLELRVTLDKIKSYLE